MRRLLVSAMTLLLGSLSFSMLLGFGLLLPSALVWQMPPL
jgi:hypothetical protein